MKNKDDRSEVTVPLESSGQALRAEEKAREKAVLSPENLEALPAEEIRRILHWPAAGANAGQTNARNSGNRSRSRRRVPNQL